jgi:hypothetical protein
MYSFRTLPHAYILKNDVNLKSLFSQETLTKTLLQQKPLNITQGLPVKKVGANGSFHLSVFVRGSWNTVYKKS